MIYGRNTSSVFTPHLMRTVVNAAMEEEKSVLDDNNDNDRRRRDNRGSFAAAGKRTSFAGNRRHSNM